MSLVFYLFKYVNIFALFRTNSVNLRASQALILIRPSAGTSINPRDPISAGWSLAQRRSRPRSDIPADLPSRHTTHSLSKLIFSPRSSPCLGIDSQFSDMQSCAAVKASGILDHIHTPSYVK